MRSAILVTLALLPFTASAQTVPAVDPYEPGLRRCFHQLLGNPSASLVEADQLLAKPSLPLIPQLRASACRAEALATLGRAKDAGAQAEAVITLLDGNALPPSEQFPALFISGSALQRIGHHRRALEIFERAHVLARESNSEKAQIDTLANLGIVHAMGLNDPQAGEPYLRKAAELSERHDTPALSDIMMLYNYGYVLLKLKRYDEAMRMFDKVLALSAQNTNQELNVFRTNSHRGEILRRTGKVDEGLRLLEAAASMQQKLPDPQGESVTLQRLASLHLESGDAPTALPLAQRALDLAETGEFPLESLDALKLLAEIHEAQGQTDQALAFTKRAHTLEMDSIRQHNLDWVGEVQTRLKDAVAGEGIAWGNRVFRANLLRNVSLAGVALALLTATFFILRLRRSRKALKHEVSVDSVTSLPSQRRAREHIASWPVHAGTQSALLLVGIGDLDRINNDFGQAVGDETLRAIAECVRTSCHKDDLVARWSGAAILILRPCTSEAAAQALAEHLCSMIANTPLELPDRSNVSLPVSIGIAPYPLFPEDTGASFEQSIHLAERTLQVAKSGTGGGWASLWGLPAGKGSQLKGALRHAQNLGLVSLAGSRSLDWDESRWAVPAAG